ncbi:hypothetical protein rosag_47020 [Roseisolibacter agri]|uniref:Cadmium-transporting ATPase n=2 Tax=Roseisolibacter agri TaxID=2014610 RepID=A0AA37Q7U5_9BACT|nr:hypothetical protein rosag_47020 [Roseisolibacter agri]
MEQTIRLDIPLLLPDVRDLQDACVTRLVRLLERRDGVARVHVMWPGEPADAAASTAAVGSGGPVVGAGVRGGPGADLAEAPQLCLHYDPERLTLAQVLRVAQSAGANVTERFAHALVVFRAVSTEDDGRRLEDGLRELPGVTAASVNLAAQLARVEYDRRRIDLPSIHAWLAEAGATPAGPPTRDTGDRGDIGGEDADPGPGVLVTGATDVHGRGESRLDAHLRGDHASSAGGARTALLSSAESRREATRAARGDDHAGHDHAADAEPATGGWYARNRELAWSLAAGALVAVGWSLERTAPGDRSLPIAVYALAYVFGARDNVGHFLGDLRRGRFRFNIDLLMVVAAIGAAVLGEWFEGALLLFLFSLGHALEHYALGRARNAIKALAELAPSRATVLQDGREVSVPIEAVRPGDRVVVRPAERIAVDGTVTDGRSAVNQAPITGESVPVDKSPGEPVFAGSVNGEGALVVSVTTAVGDRTLDRVIRLVSEAQTQKAPTQQFTERFERVFVPVVLVGDVLLAVVPPLLGWWTWPEAFYRAMALLVAASPCALALGTPAAVLAGIAQAARGGVLIKGGAHLETLGSVEVLALDKTGTITVGEPAVTDVEPLWGGDRDVLLATAAAVERRSQHPLAKAVVRAAEERRLEIPATGELESVTGKGVRAVIGADVVEIGRLLMFEQEATSVASATNGTASDPAEPAAAGRREGRTEQPGGVRAGSRASIIPAEVAAIVKRLEAAGRTTMVVRRRRADAAAAGDGTADGLVWLGVLGLADEPRAGVAETLRQLRAAGTRRIVMLTGDNAGVGNAVGQAVGVDEVRASLLPEDKVTAIRELAATGRVAMVGDGVNDAPALAHATVGIAMGGAGTAAALETADVALMGDDLGRLPFAIGLSRRARAVIKQNLIVSLGVIGVLAVATVTGAAGIGAAVVVHEGSTLVVIANALRLLAFKGPRSTPARVAQDTDARAGRPRGPREGGV